MLPHPNKANLQFEGYFMIHRLPHTEGRPRKARGPPPLLEKKNPHSNWTRLRRGPPPLERAVPPPGPGPGPPKKTRNEFLWGSFG